MPKLKNWYFDKDRRLRGNVVDSPVFKNGEEIVTTPVEYFDLVIKRAKTKNTWYDLGQEAK